MLYKLFHMITTRKTHYLLGIIVCNDSDIKSAVNCKQSATLVILLFFTQVVYFPLFWCSKLGRGLDSATT